MPLNQSDFQLARRRLVGYVKVKGFTLIEIMAVIFIVSIMLAMISLSMGGRSQRQLDLEAQQLAEQIRYAIDESQTSRNEFGLKILEETKYHFYHFDDQTMDWIEDEGYFLKPIELFGGHFIEIDQSESVDPVLYKHETRSRITDYGEGNNNVPDVIFYSDGTTSAFVISILDKAEKDLVRHIRVDHDGSVVIDDEN